MKSWEGGRVTWMDLPAVLVVDADVLGLELGEVDACDGLAVDDEEDAVAA